MTRSSSRSCGVASRWAWAKSSTEGRASVDCVERGSMHFHLLRWRREARHRTDEVAAGALLLATLPTDSHAPLHAALSTDAEDRAMPSKSAIQRARKDKREGKSPSTQAGEFVREEIEHIREGKHGARSTKQAIAIGLSEARRAGVDVPAKGKAAKKSAAKKSAAKKSGAKKSAAKKSS